MLAADLHTRVLGLLQRGRIRGVARFHRWPGSMDPSERERIEREKNKSALWYGYPQRALVDALGNDTLYLGVV
jgi:hypothetical protein